MEEKEYSKIPILDFVVKYWVVIVLIGGLVINFANNNAKHAELENRIKALELISDKMDDKYNKINELLSSLNSKVDLLLKDKILK